MSGGKREGAGAKVKPANEKGQKVTVSLPPDVWQALDLNRREGETRYAAMIRLLRAALKLS